MKRFVLSSLIFLGALPTMVFANNCDQTKRVIGTTLTTLISGNTVCATRGSERWQEQHRNPQTNMGVTRGELWDYKKGEGHPIDPSKKVGTWEISRNIVTYCYTGGRCYSYSVHSTHGGTYSFCSIDSNPNEVVGGATFKTGLTSCP